VGNVNADSYRTISSKIRNEIKIIDSRFIASAFPVSVKEEAEDIIKQVRIEFYDANHNCFAYRIGISGEVFRYSDDGEPSGTAGVKIFRAIQSKNISDILIVVTRYFGGTKLAVPTSIQR
jgi:putative IMPACT (imprinted ancient) family translation regulator